MSTTLRPIEEAAPADRRFFFWCRFLRHLRRTRRYYGGPLDGADRYPL